MKEYLTITKALSDANRVRMLCALRGGELCVCQLVDLLQLAPSTVSKHLSIMSQAGLVENRKQGRWVYYRLPQKAESNTVARMAKETFRAVSNSAVIVEDERRFIEIGESDLEEPCRKNL